MSTLIYKVISSGDSALLLVTDLVSSESMQVPNWNDLDSDKRDDIMKRIESISSGSLTPEEGNIAHLRDYAFSYDGEENIKQAREELGVTILDNGGVEINGTVFPERFVELLKPFNDIEDARAVVKFADLLSRNPFPHTCEALIEWIIANPDLSFTDEGHVVGYRGVGDDFHSLHRGYGIVNGVEYENSALDNTPGNVLEFPRFMVDMDPSVYCSVGLHVGTWGYAIQYSPFKHISVSFSPEDVVSPPNDAAQHKIRVCKMKVIEEIDAPYDGGVITAAKTVNEENNDE